MTSETHKMLQRSQSKNQLLFGETERRRSIQLSMNLRNGSAFRSINLDDGEGEYSNPQITAATLER